MHPILEHHEIMADLTERCLQLANRYGAIYQGNPANGLRASMAGQRAQELAELLARPGGNAAAQLIQTHLVSDLELRGTDFWGTPLGRACGWWTGAGQIESNGEDVMIVTPQARVAPLLGMSRQSAFEMTAKGRLKRLHLVGVDPADVRREMQARYPL